MRKYTKVNYFIETLFGKHTISSKMLPAGVLFGTAVEKWLATSDYHITVLEFKF